MTTSGYHPKKILFIESGTLGGGSFVSLTQHLAKINQRKFIPIIICFNKTKYWDIWEKMDIKTYQLDDRVYSIKDQRIISKIYKNTFSKFLRLIPFMSLLIMRVFFRETINEIKEIIEKEDISLIHLNDNILRDAFGAIVVEKTGLPCISHLRSINTRHFDKGLALFCNKNIRSFIANSEMTKLHWSRLGVDASKTTVIYNGIDINDAKAVNLRQEFEIPQEYKTIIGCIANLADAKGHMFLLNAFSKLQSKDYCLVLVGHGPLESELKAQASTLGIIDSVRFVGYQTEPMGIMRSFDILVVPSKREAFGRTILEGMMARIPIVATNVGGIPEVVQDKKSGLIVNYEDVDGLVKAIQEIAENKVLRNKLIQNAEERLMITFTIQKYVVSVEKLYEQMLQEAE